LEEPSAVRAKLKLRALDERYVRPAIRATEPDGAWRGGTDFPWIDRCPLPRGRPANLLDFGVARHGGELAVHQEPAVAHRRPRTHVVERPIHPPTARRDEIRVEGDRLEIGLDQQPLTTKACGEPVELDGVVGSRDRPDREVLRPERPKALLRDPEASIPEVPGRLVARGDLLEIEKEIAKLLHTPP
jgi:hypothetical protein